MQVAWGGLLLMLLLAGCGQVITLEPTPVPTATPTVNVALMAATAPPTATPAPVTPAPTATPTITPTPVTHVVSAGESLLGLAQQYNVSVQLLQEANGILDPRTLQIGQELIVPEEDALDPVAGLTPTPTPMPVTVSGVQIVETRLGGLWVMGEIRNSGSGMLERAEGGAAFMDAAGNTLLTVTVLSPLDLVRPGEAAPFALFVERAPADFERYAVYAASAVPGYAGSYYRDLDVRQLEGRPAGNASYAVQGAVFNVGTEEATNVNVVLTAYNQQDQVIAVRRIATRNSIIPPDGNVKFDATLTPLGGPVARVVALAQARRGE